MNIDLFEEIMRPSGGRLRESHADPTSWAMVKISKDFLQWELSLDQETCMRRRQWQGATLGIEFDILADSSINAIAKANISLEAIGLNVGLVVFIQNAFYALMSSDFFLPNVGDTKADRSPPELVAKNIAITDITNGWGFLSPRDTERKRMAFNLSRLAELFVFHHEISHITYGHLLHAELQNINNVAMISEYFRHAGPTSSRLLQAMEFDADEGAAVRSIDFAIEILELLPLFKGSTRAERMYYWALSTAILFRVLDLFTKSPQLDVAGTHPPPGPRTDHVIYCGRERVRTTYTKEFEVYESVSRKALLDVSDLWRILGLPAVTHQLDPQKRYAFVQSLRDDLLKFDVLELDQLLRKRGKLIETRFAARL